MLRAWLQGTVVTAGRGRACVVGTGQRTAIGKIRWAARVVMRSVEEVAPFIIEHCPSRTRPLYLNSRMGATCSVRIYAGPEPAASCIPSAAHQQWQGGVLQGCVHNACSSRAACAAVGGLQEGRMLSRHHSHSLGLHVRILPSWALHEPWSSARPGCPQQPQYIAMQ